MNVFQQIWQNWIRNHVRFAQWPTQEELPQLNELNQAVFARLEKILPSYVKVRAVTAPVFIYYTEAAGGYGVDTHSGCVHTRWIDIHEEKFEDQVDSVVKQLVTMIEEPCVRTVFFYMPIYPMDDNGHMVVRLMTTGETVDVKEPA